MKNVSDFHFTDSSCIAILAKDVAIQWIAAPALLFTSKKQPTILAFVAL
jgi:hypothetical protein